MTSVPLRASRRTSLLYCFALCTFWPVDAWTQGAPVSRDLDPVVVTSPAPPAATKRRGGDKRAASSARSRRQRAAVATAAAPAPSPAASAAPTLNLTGPASSGSRLNLTRLQTPASVEVITAETIAERGQHNVLDAVTQNATGFTASPAPGNGSLAFNTRGFSGNGTVMTLYDGTRLYVGAGTLTFPFDTWSAQRIEVLRGPASVMYGEGAIGGAINVISKMPLTTPRNEGEISLDTNLTRRLAVDSGGRSTRMSPTGSPRSVTCRMAGSIATRRRTSRCPPRCACRPATPWHGRCPPITATAAHCAISARRWSMAVSTNRCGSRTTTSMTATSAIATAGISSRPSGMSPTPSRSTTWCIT